MYWKVLAMTATEIRGTVAAGFESSKLKGKVGYARLPKGPRRSANMYGGTGIGINGVSPERQDEPCPRRSMTRWTKPELAGSSHSIGRSFGASSGWAWNSRCRRHRRSTVAMAGSTLPTW